MEARNRPVKQAPNGRLGGILAGEFVQITLDDGRCAFLGHCSSLARFMVGVR
jgi:hypothetical protein